MGAGDGSLIVLNNWLKPSRSDLKFYAYSLEKGEHFDLYHSFELGTWPHSKPNFNGIKFDAIYAAHFIEHVEDPIAFIEWCSFHLNKNGRMYIEWPSRSSQIQPKKNEFNDVGIPLIISNYYDDSTHNQSVPDKEKIKLYLEHFNLHVDTEGVIVNPHFEDEVLAHFNIGKCDPVALTFAYWSRARWAQYVVATMRQ